MANRDSPISGFFSLLFCVFFAFVAVMGVAVLVYTVGIMRADDDQFALGMIFVILALSLTAVGVRGIFYMRAKRGGILDDPQMQRFSKLAQRDPASVLLGGTIVLALSLVIPLVLGTPGEAAFKIGLEVGGVGLIMILVGATQLSRERATRKAAARAARSAPTFDDGYR